MRVLTYERTDPRDTSIAWMREQGIDVRHGRADADPAFRHYAAAEIVADAQGCVAVLGSSAASFPRGVIKALPELRFISKIGIGVDTIDVAAATERGILVSNTPDAAGVAAVAEHAIALMLALRKRLPTWTPAFMRAGGWRGEEFASMMEGTSVGIVGFGRIGRAVARRLSGWDVTLLAHDPLPVLPVDGVTMLALPDLLAQADIVTLHCGATASNRHMIDGAALARMRPGALLINTGRGSLVDAAALVSALRGERLAGAGLDVFEQEPPDPADPLFTLPNVVVTPHSATRTLDAFLGRRMQAARNLAAMMTGAPCPDIVNPPVSTPA